MDQDVDSMISALILIGNEGMLKSPTCFKKYYDFPKDRDWLKKLAESISDYDLKHLIKGLILVSQSGEFFYGSGSPVITLYYHYTCMYPETEPNLTAWIADNRCNDYEPFGTCIHGNARSLKEYKAYRVNLDSQKFSLPMKALERNIFFEQFHIKDSHFLDDFK